jgi:hypothetical protein
MSWIDELPRQVGDVPIHHIRWTDIEEHAPPDELESLSKWLFGQTMLMCDDGTAGIYTHDFDRWVRQGRNTEQGSDWD